MDEASRRSRVIAMPESSCNETVLEQSKALDLHYAHDKVRQRLTRVFAHTALQATKCLFGS